MADTTKPLPAPVISGFNVNLVCTGYLLTQI